MTGTLQLGSGFWRHRAPISRGDTWRSRSGGYKKELQAGNRLWRRLRLLCRSYSPAGSTTALVWFQ